MRNKLQIPFKHHSSRNILLSLLVCLVLQACATLNPDYEQPSVMLSSFKAVPAEGSLPSFEIGLRIINPNPEPLNLEGVVYSISLQDFELLKGVGKDYPQIDGYSEGNILLNANVNVIKSVRFIAAMTKNEGKPLEYTFQAKLDVGGFFPSLKITETGTFNNGDFSPGTEAINE